MPLGFLIGGVPSTSVTATHKSYSRASETVIFLPIYMPFAYIQLIVREATRVVPGKALSSELKTQNYSCCFCSIVVSDTIKTIQCPRIILSDYEPFHFIGQMLIATHFGKFHIRACLNSFVRKPQFTNIYQYLIVWSRVRTVGAAVEVLATQLDATDSNPTINMKVLQIFLSIQFALIVCRNNADPKILHQSSTYLY